MYDWIPMKFNFQFKTESGIVHQFMVYAHSDSREFFTIYLPDGRIGNSSYPLKSLMTRLTDYQGKINGMMLEELTGTQNDDKIDISSLI